MRSTKSAEINFQNEEHGVREAEIKNGIEMKGLDRMRLYISILKTHGIRAITKEIEGSKILYFFVFLAFLFDIHSTWNEIFRRTGKWQAAKNIYANEQATREW